MVQNRSQSWRLDRRIPIRVWVAVGGVAIVSTVAGELMLGSALDSYKSPLAQYAAAHDNLDEVAYRSLAPVPAPSQAAYVEGTLGAWSAGVGLLLAVLAAMVGLVKVRVRWLLFRALIALTVAVYSAVTFANVAPSVFFKFMYVNSTDCVGGCYFTPDPVGGWLLVVAIATIVSAFCCAGLLLVAVVRVLLRSSAGKRAVS